MIDSAAENLIPLSRAGEHSPTAVHPATWHRWALRGARGVRLETVYVGHRIYTSREAIARFFTRINGDADGETTPPSQPRTPRDRGLAASAAKRELARMG